MATCHPDKPLVGRGMCRRCYKQAHRAGFPPGYVWESKVGKGRPPDCHPDRPHMGRGMCPPCYRRAYYAANRERFARLSKAWNDKNPHAYLSKYGLTSEQWDEMFAAQGGVCAICKQPSTGRRMAVDHDHETGRVRALLCASCNRGIGHFRERPATMYQAIRYLYAQQAAAEGLSWPE